MNNYLGVNGLPPIFAPFTPVAPIQEQAPSEPKLPADIENNSVHYRGDFGGCGWWRLQLPELHINYSKLGSIHGMTKLIPDENFYNDIKSVRLQRQASPEHLAFMTHLRKIADKRNIKLIYEIDDVILRDDIPDFNVAKEAYADDKILKSTMAMMSMCDQMTVTCQYLKDYLEEKTGHKNITIIPNRASKMWFDGLYNTTKLMTAFDKNTKRPRILYAGSGNHFNLKQLKNQHDDFTHVLDVIVKTRKQFKWVFMGSFPLELKPYIDCGDMELHDWAPIMNYPHAISALDVNAVIAPLVDCTFNRAKSNIKYLESAYLGIPGVFQDIITYKEAPLRFTTGDEMIDNLKKLLNNRQYYAKMSKSARNYANTMWIDDHIGEYETLYFK